ncbi:MAG TPA: hypothetical protein VN675_00845 [Burkholderiales bacterium]|nr:hypothetical protein [Burkholderiales bacterium]
MKKVLLLVLFASPVFAAPKIENLSAKANTKSPEVEIAITVSKTGGNCDVRVDFGDGRGRTVDFGVATSRTLKYTYRKGGNFKVSAKGAGKTPCEGAKEVALNIAGPAAEKKAAEKKAEKKKAEKKKADKKSAPKKEEPK